MQIGSCTNGSTPVAGVSGKFFVTGNLFRTRDAIRQDILDSSALILALAPPSVPLNPLAAELASKGVMIDPTKVYWVGQSLGGILGTLNAAANPRISRAVLNVPGATVVDVFTNSPAFSSQIAALLASLTPPIVAGTPEYLQFIQVAKLVLDGGEPVNFARHLTGDAAHPTLSNLLATPPVSQDAKSVFGQFAVCDQVIPNPFNLFLFDQIGLTQNTAPNTFVQYTVAGSGSPGACVTPENPAHGFLLNAIDAPATGAGQSDAAAYLLDLTAPTGNRP
jgi:pimeloyl-ACP methyl ester carboxylesterase